jgi:pimeloyl-ACP methyl ester carboxylesterase
MSVEPRCANINGTQLAYFESGSGEPVVFVHGAITDHRFWSPQVQALPDRYRWIAPDQRYFGQSWPNGGHKFSLETHAEDLRQFLQTEVREPVHGVATSYGSAVVLACAVASPSLFKSLCLNEPSLVSLVADPEDLQVLAQGRKDLARVFAALSERNAARAVELFCDWTAFDGAFKSVSDELKTVFLENARTVELQVAAPRPTVTAAQIAQLNVPVTFTTGEKTTPFYEVQVRAAHRALPRSRLVSIPNAHHAPSFENPAAFNAALLTHLARSVGC